MKKLFALMLALIMVFSLAACGSAPTEDPTVPDATEAVKQNDFPGAVLTYEDVKDGGAVTIVWTLTLRVDGTFYLEENNPFAGVTEHAGESYTVEGNTVKCVGMEPFAMSDLFNVTEFTATFNEQYFAPEGCELQEPKSDHLSDYQTVPGTYNYEDYKADFDFSIYWTLELKEDGTFTLTEDNSMIGAVETHNGASYEVDGDIVTLRGLEPFGMDDIFKKTEVVVITSEDMTFIPKEAMQDDSEETEAPEDEGAAAVGSYTFNEAKEGKDGSPMVIKWILKLNEDGTFTLTESHPMKGDTENAGAGYTVEGDTITLTGLEVFEMSDIFNAENMTVTFNEQHFAPEGFELEAVTLYSFEETKEDTGLVLNWTLMLNEDGTFVLTEINPNFPNPKVYHGNEYTIEGNLVHCGHMEDGPAMGDWAVETDGFTVEIDAEAMTFVPVV